MSQKLFSLSTCCRLALSQQSLAVVFLREAQRSISSTTVATSAVTRSRGALAREPTLPFLFPSGRFQYPVQHVNTRRTLSLTTRSRQRLFSSTSPRTAETVALQNPRTNEEGKELSVTISPRAAKVCLACVFSFCFRRFHRGDGIHVRIIRKRSARHSIYSRRRWEIGLSVR